MSWAAARAERAVRGSGGCGSRPARAGPEVWAVRGEWAGLLREGKGKSGNGLGRRGGCGPRGFGAVGLGFWALGFLSLL